MNIPLPRDGDEQDRFPLGKPVRREAPAKPEWVPVGSTPGIYKHRDTGRMKNDAPPPPEPEPTPWYTIVPIGDPWDGFQPE